MTAGPLRGCLAAVLLPVLAPLAALARSRAVARRGDRILAEIERHNAPRLVVRFDVPLPRRATFARALAATAGRVAVELGGTVGVVGIVAGEEPALAAYASRSDLVAARLERDLLAGESHLIPHLYLSLPAGRYLAEAIDPYAVFAGNDEEVLPIIERAGSPLAVLMAPRRGAVSEELMVGLWGDLGACRAALAAGRAELSRLEGWASLSDARGPGRAARRAAGG